MTTPDPQNVFTKRFTETEQLSVIAAAVSMKWGLHVIADAFGIHWQTVVAMRNGRNGKYKQARLLIDYLGKDDFVKQYLTQDVVDRVNSVAKIPKKFRG